jgi:hypothetical protein
MQERRRFDIEEMAKRLEMRQGNNHHTTLLLGARAGELFRSEHFYSSLQQFSNRDFSKLSRPERFGECYRILTQTPFSETDIHSVLRKSLENLTITKADDCLAELVKQGHFAEIISTNIDDGLERALMQAEMKEQREFEVFIPGRGSLRHERSLPCRIIKIFGDLASREYNISSHHSHLESDQELKRTLQRILEEDILIVGIDPVWDEDILRAIPGRSGTIWFVNEEDLTGHSLISSMLQARRTECIVGGEGRYDNFARTLHRYLYGGIPINYRLAYDILNELQVLHNEHQSILTEIKKLRSEIEFLLQLPPRQ